MTHITTYTGLDFNPITPETDLICIEDIAHALSMMCRANGHFKSFFSVAQHCINCTLEARARGFTRKIQLACLLHDASEAYLSDITRPVKTELQEYSIIERRLQTMIYKKFLHEDLTDEEYAIVQQIDDNMLICEFNALMGKAVFATSPVIYRNPDFSFRMFADVENEYISLFGGNFGCIDRIDLKLHISQIENSLATKNKYEISEFLRENKITDTLFANKLELKKLSAQIDVVIHAYGILLTLPKILSENEKILSLSLGAGNTGKKFDVETTARVAEYKFINWTGKSDTIRENGLFKDFVELVTAETDKEKFIYCYNVDIVKAFLNRNRSLKSVLFRSDFKEKFYDRFGTSYQTVADFYRDYENDVSFVDLQGLL